nr:serine hydrolase [uncultured Blautia sp.]
MKCTDKIQTEKQKKKRLQKIRKTVFLLLFFIIFLLAGVLGLLMLRNAGKLKEAFVYDRSQSFFGTEARESALIEKGIARDLCVGASNTPMDGIESQEGEAAGFFDIEQKEIPYAQNLHEKISFGAINRLMTALVAYEQLDPEESLTIDAEDVVSSSWGVSSGLSSGNVITVGQLIHAVLVSSADDASYALARAASGDRESFVEQMNQKAHELGMTNTQFANITGAEDEDQYTTVYDSYLLANQLLKYPDLINTMGLSICTMNATKSNGDLKQQILNSDNPYVTGSLSVPRNVTVLGGTFTASRSANNTLLLVQNNYGDVFVLIVCRADSEKNMNTRIWEMLEKVNS